MRPAAIILVPLLMTITLAGFQNCARVGLFGEKSSSSESAPPPLNLGIPRGGGSAPSRFVELPSTQAAVIGGTYPGTCTSSYGASSGFQLIAPGASITNSGDGHYRGTSVANISGTGNILLYATVNGARATSVSALTGNLVACAMSVEFIGNSTSANVVVDGGGVGAIDGFTGNLIILGGDFPASVSRFVGNIVVLTAPGTWAGRQYSY